MVINSILFSPHFQCHAVVVAGTGVVVGEAAAMAAMAGVVVAAAVVVTTGSLWVSLVGTVAC